MTTIVEQPFTDTLLFQELSDNERDRLVSIAKVRKLGPRQYLFHQHSPADSLYTIGDGALMVERSSSRGQRQILAFIFAGNFVGFTHNDFFEYSVKSLNDVNAMEYPRLEFLALCDEIPQLKKNIDRITSNVMLRLFDQLFALGQKKSHERVCFLLQQLADRQAGNALSFELIMTRQDIADYLGLTLETVSRAFSRLQKDEIIKVSMAHQLEILAPDKLKELAFSS